MVSSFVSDGLWVTENGMGGRYEDINFIFDTADHVGCFLFLTLFAVKTL